MGKRQKIPLTEEEGINSVDTSRLQSSKCYTLEDIVGQLDERGLKTQDGTKAELFARLSNPCFRDLKDTTEFRHALYEGETVRSKQLNPYTNFSVFYYPTNDALVDPGLYFSRNVDYLSVFD